MIMSFIVTMVPYAIVTIHLCLYLTQIWYNISLIILSDLNPKACEEQTVPYTVVTHLSFASCLINPVVYCFHSPRYRREIVIWFMDKFLKLPQRSAEMHNRN